MLFARETICENLPVPASCAYLINTDIALSRAIVGPPTPSDTLQDIIPPEYYIEFTPWELVSYVDPLIESEWGQNYPYYLHLDQIDGQFPPVGCVATAVAQIMGYYKRPSGYDWAQLVQYNAETGEKKGVLYEEKHARYVEPQHPLAFLPWDETKFIYWSQRDGYHHLYLMDTQKPQAGEWKTGKDADDTYCEYLQTTPLTQGDWLVQEILGFNKKMKTVIIGSTEISPLQTNVFSLDVKTGKRTLIGKRDGMHRAQLSENGTFLIDNFTSNDVPREISILPTNGKKGVTLLTATDPMKEQYNLPEISIGTIKAADGETDLYYRLIKPVNFDPKKKYPAIIYVYGGPHAQMIHNTRFYDARGTTGEAITGVSGSRTARSAS